MVYRIIISKILTLGLILHKQYCRATYRSRLVYASRIGLRFVTATRDS